MSITGETLSAPCTSVIIEGDAAKVAELLETKLQHQMLNILRDQDKLRHFAIEIMLIDLPSTVISKLLREPDRVLPELNEVAANSLRRLFNDQPDDARLSVKSNVHVRIYCMFEGTPALRTKFPVDTSDSGQFFGVHGMVLRSTKPKLLEMRRTFKCATCDSLVIQEAKRSRFYTFPKTLCCRHCSSGKLLLVKTPETRQANVIDYQEIVLQELNEDRSESSKLGTLTILCENDLIEKAIPGDIVTITIFATLLHRGTLFTRWGKFVENSYITVEHVFLANHISVCNPGTTCTDTLTTEIVEEFEAFWRFHARDPFRGLHIILHSLCQEQVGLYLPKLAIAVSIAGGVEKLSDEAMTRGDCHLLLCGEPGISKSMLLKYVSKIIPRSIYLTGTNITGAGLGAAVVKDASNQYVLTAGSMVLANGSVVLIDEINHMDKEAMNVLYETAEQQTLSISKAGIITTLNCKTTIISACNPKDIKYDPNESLETNINLPLPILSRFDLLLVLRNNPCRDYDEDLVTKFLDASGSGNSPSVGQLWENQKLTDYFMYIKNKKPKMSKDAFLVLSKYFECQRARHDVPQSRSTLRLLPSLVRIAEGIAKLMNRNDVIIFDAVEAVTLVDLSMQSAAMWPIEDVLHVKFPDNAMDSYYKKAECVLSSLKLFSMCKKELEMLTLLRTAN